MQRAQEQEEGQEEEREREGWTVFGMNESDPFHRLSCCDDPIILVIEFCQVEGPRPVLSIPNNPGPYLDKDAVALWLMSSEMTPGCVVQLRSEPLAVHALVVHVTLLDVTARAFQRPFCIALLTARRPDDDEMRRFSIEARRLLRPVIECNRNRFLDHLTDVLNGAEPLCSSTNQSYYSLCPTPMEQDSSTWCNERLESITTTGRRFYTRLQNAHNRLGLTRCPTSCCHIHDTARMEQLLIAQHGIALVPLEQIAPCAYGHFVEQLNTLQRDIIRRQSRGENHRLFSLSSGTRPWSLSSGSRPILYPSKSRPILYPSGTRLYPSRHDQIAIRQCPLELFDEGEGENSLRTVITHLDQLLFPILLKLQLTISGSKLRWPTVTDFHSKLNRLNIKGARDGDSSSLIIRHLSGGHNLSSTGCLLDLNRGHLRAPIYTGGILNRFNGKRSRSFPSEGSLIAFIQHVITEMALAVYVYHSLIEHYRDDEICRMLQLSISDMAIVRQMFSSIGDNQNCDDDLNANADRLSLPMRVLKL